MRKVLFNLHLYGALIVGLFIVTIGVTGSIMAFEDDLDRLFNPRLFKVQATGKPLAIADLFRAASAAFPGEKINNLRLPQSATETVTFRVRGPKQVFMNPYNGQIDGMREGTSTLQTIHTIHLTLLIGPVGRTVVTIVTAVLLFLVVSGICLWWQYKRFSVKWSASARRVNFDLHNAAGIYSAAFLLVLGITGITVHYDDALEHYLHSRAGTKATLRNTPSVKPAGPGRPSTITPDQAVESALAALPGTRVLSVSLPPNPRASYFVAVRYPEDLTPGGRSWVNVDQYSGKAINIQSSRTAPTAVRTIILNRAIHTGDIFGYLTKIIVSLSSLMLVIQAITGYYMWWKKLRANQPAAPKEREAVPAI
jgi:uncharacterized iron-regulated membrane protein